MELVRTEALLDHLDLVLLARLEPEQVKSEWIASVSSMNALTRTSMFFNAISLACNWPLYSP